ncbi:MAG: hypothetical protein H7322_10160 [Ramlibacter sp.]|nr:hypothetical protein [Ramlibacter sp.]
MEPDRAKDRKAHSQRDEYKAASDNIREAGRTLQRKSFQQQTESFWSTGTASHGEDSSFDTLSNPPQSDRAG